MPATCIVCHSKHKKKDDRTVSMFRFPSDKETHDKWLSSLELRREDVKPHSRVCSRHFLNGDPSQIPSLHLGKRLYSPKKKAPVKRMALKSPDNQFRPPKRPALSTSPAPVCLSSSHGSSSYAHGESSDTDSSLFASIGEPLVSDYSVHELPGMSSVNDSDNVVLNAGLLARVEYLEAELKKSEIIYC